VDRHRQGGRLHLPRPRRNHDDGSNHQAGARAGRRRGRQVSSPACTLGAYVDLKAKGKKITVAYVFDTERGIKLFADQAFFTVGGSEIAPFLLKKDAEAHAAKIGGKVVNFNDALKSAMNGG
jgi:uncharacterized protein YehS (DUF1456 family)